jgi:hypothetical protein
LRAEGYEIDIRDGHVVVTNVPYVTPEQDVDRDSIVVALTTSGDRAGSPPDHTVMWTGAMPCHQDGQPISRIHAGEIPPAAPALPTQHRFSSKPQPAGRYENYYDQITSYINIISNEAQALDPKATAQTFVPIETSPEESVFVYEDSASSRAGIRMANEKLATRAVAIVGLGGTGSYVLDLVAKTPVAEVHLYDDDILLNHNAFRAPGAAPLDVLREQPLKVDYYAATYGEMHRGLVPHRVRLDESNADELASMSFVFLCMDGGPDKLAIVDALEQAEVPFIDAGLGLYEKDASIGGILRVTLSTPENRAAARARMSFEDPDDDANEYVRNIQVADLNMLNAALAVERWKKHFGFYRDEEGELSSLFTVEANQLLNEDKP